VGKSREIEALAVQLRTFLVTHQWKRGMSVGRCAETSVFVTRVLNEVLLPANWRSIAGRFVGHGYHCWSTNDEIILDLTADQFDSTLPGVLIVPLDDQRYHVDCTNTSEYRESEVYYQAWLRRR
jgi:hypothetical protein